jgi:hypothetical protein
LPLPHQLHPSDVALAAGQDLFVNDRAWVLGRTNAIGVTGFSRGHNGFISHMGTPGSMRIGVTSLTGTVMSSGSPMIADRAFINGGVYTSSPVQWGDRNSVTIQGTLKENQPYLTDFSWQTQITWPDTINPPVMLDPGGTPNPYTLAPGAYQSVNVKTGRRLVLQAGQYFFGSWFQEPGSEVALAPSTQRTSVYLQQSLTFRGNMVDHRAEGAPGLMVLSFGTGLTDIISNTFMGTVMAPAGTIHITTATTGEFRGSAFARRIIVFEGSRVVHIRDPFAFLDFRSAPLVDRVSVTGGINSSGRANPTVPTTPIANPTDEFEQAEAVAAVSRVNPTTSTHNVTVAYNDRTQNFNPLLVYPDGRTGATRQVHKGVTLMGWSFSTDGGYTFHYGGRVSPPAGWSAIWGDPALAKLDLDDPYVYYGEMAATTAAFEGSPTYTPVTQTVDNETPSLDGHCISRSTDRGVRFPTVSCVQAGTFHDGTSLAVARDSNGTRQVYLTSHDVGGTNRASVWRMQGETMAFTRLPDPFPVSISLHPRLRVFNGVLYVAAHAGSAVIANRLTTANNSTTWLGQVTIATGVASSNTLPLQSRTLRQANQFSFDVGQNLNAQTRLRVMFTASTGTSHQMRTRECNADLTGCADAPWVAAVMPEQRSPSLRHFNRRWVATWWGTAPQFFGNTVFSFAGMLGETSPFPITVREIGGTGNPCDSQHPSKGNYWGDYNEIDAFAGGAFFAPITTNGGACRFQGPWTADMHVRGAVIRF